MSSVSNFFFSNKSVQDVVGGASSSGGGGGGGGNQDLTSVLTNGNVTSLDMTVGGFTATDGASLGFGGTSKLNTTSTGISVTGNGEFVGYVSGAQAIASNQYTTLGQVDAKFANVAYTNVDNQFSVNQEFLSTVRVRNVLSVGAADNSGTAIITLLSSTDNRIVGRDGSLLEFWQSVNNRGGVQTDGTWLFKNDATVDGDFSSTGVGAFTGTVSGANATASNHFVTLQQLNAVSEHYVNSVDFNTSTGDLTLGRLGLSSLTENLDGRYLTSFTETDPTVPSYVKAITTTDISNWDSAFSFSSNYDITDYYSTLDTRYAKISDLPDLTNVAYTNVDNNFSVGQTINGNATVKSQISNGASAEIYLLATNRSSFGNTYAINSKISTTDVDGTNPFHSQVQIWANDTSNVLQNIAKFTSSTATINGNATVNGTLSVDGSVINLNGADTTISNNVGNLYTRSLRYYIQNTDNTFTRALFTDSLATIYTDTTINGNATVNGSLYLYNTISNYWRLVVDSSTNLEFKRGTTLKGEWSESLLTIYTDTITNGNATVKPSVNGTVNTSTEDFIRLTRRNLNRPSIQLGTASNTYSNNVWSIENNAGDFQISRPGLGALTIQNSGEWTIGGSTTINGNATVNGSLRLNNTNDGLAIQSPTDSSGWLGLRTVEGGNPLVASRRERAFRIIAYSTDTPFSGFVGNVASFGWDDGISLNKNTEINGNATVNGNLTFTGTVNGGSSSQFLKGDGSLDGNTYLTSADLSNYARKDIAETFASNVTVNGRVVTDEIRNRTGQQLVLNAGESSSYATGQTDEFIYVNAEQGLQINASADNWASGWAGRVTHSFGRSSSTIGTPLTVSGNTTVNGQLNVTTETTYSTVDRSGGLTNRGYAGIYFRNGNPAGSGAYRGMVFYATGWSGSAVTTYDVMEIIGTSAIPIVDVKTRFRVAPSATVRLDVTDSQTTIGNNTEINGTATVTNTLTAVNASITSWAADSSFAYLGHVNNNTSTRYALRNGSDGQFTFVNATNRVGLRINNVEILKVTSSNVEVTTSLTVAGVISGNGSGLTNVNATTLDGIDGANFLRSDTNDTMNGILTVRSGSQQPLIVESTTTSVYQNFRTSSGLSGYIGSGSGLVSGYGSLDMAVRAQSQYVVIATNGGNARARFSSIGLEVFGDATVSGNVYANGTAFYGDNKNAIQFSDSYLRLNQSGSFANGVYTPGVLRADGSFVTYRDDVGQILGSYNTSAGNPLQFQISHNYGNVNIDNKRGALNIRNNSSTTATFSSSAITLYKDTNVTGTLTVNGTANVGGLRSTNFSTGALGYQLENGNATNVTMRFEADNFRFFAGNGGSVPLTIREGNGINVVGNADVSGNVTANNFVKGSARHKKKLIEDLNFSWQDACKVQPRQYVKKASDKAEFGYIIDELPEKLQEVVSEDKESLDYDSVNTAMIAAMMQEIKELRKEIEELKK